MSKFFKIDDDLINLSRISNVIFKEEKLTISFKTPEKQNNLINVAKIKKIMKTYVS